MENKGSTFCTGCGAGPYFLPLQRSKWIELLLSQRVKMYHGTIIVHKLHIVNLGIFQLVWLEVSAFLLPHLNIWGHRIPTFTYFLGPTLIRGKKNLNSPSFTVWPTTCQAYFLALSIPQHPKETNFKLQWNFLSNNFSPCWQ